MQSSYLGNVHVNFVTMETILNVLGGSKKFSYLTGYGIKCMWLIFKSKMFIYLSNCNLDEKIVSVESLIPRNW